MAVNLISVNDEDRIVRAWPLLEKYLRETKEFEEALGNEIGNWYQLVNQSVTSASNTAL